MRGNISINYSPNFSPIKRNYSKIKFIILHYTGMKSEIKAIRRLTSVLSKVSCHYFVSEKGNVIQMVPEKYVAWHAGKSCWKKYKFLNDYSIGIEIHNKGHENGYLNFKKKQINQLLKLLKTLKKKYKINKNNILGHSDISYNRKKDPGEKFPWKILAKKKLINWYHISNKQKTKIRSVQINYLQKKKFLNNLKKIGYSKAKNSIENKKLIIAFQRKYRQDLINGIVDKECYEISNKVNKY